jgi:hypothetical protein
LAGFHPTLIGRFSPDRRGEDALDVTYQNYVKRTEDDIACLLVIAPYLPNYHPLMYKTVGTALVEKSLYGAAGTGEAISNYLSDRLYKHPMDNVSLGTLAAFVLREAEGSTSGVGGGLGFDMVFIRDKEQRRRYIPKEYMVELQSCIPKLGDAVWSHWKQNAKVPKWLED